MPAQETAKDYIPLARPALIYTPFAKVEKEYPLIQFFRQASKVKTTQWIPLDHIGTVGGRRVCGTWKEPICWGWAGS